MPDMSKAFGGGEYLRAADLEGKGDVPVVIANVGLEQIRSDNGMEDKWVISFAGKKRRLVLNVTNNNALIDQYGYESDDWIGKRVILHVVTVQFQQRSVPGIRIKCEGKREKPTLTSENTAVTPETIFPPALPDPPRPQHQAVADADIPF